MKDIRPIPYYTQMDDTEFKKLAHQLRQQFLPLVKSKFAMHHLKAFKQGDIINYIKKWKKDYPAFLRTDIKMFYANVDPKDLVVQTQMAYKALRGQFPTHEFILFKEKYHRQMMKWVASLPVNVGIPLGSCMSAILAPLGLIPVWLNAKRRYDIKMIIFMDDALIMCRDESTSKLVWKLLAADLHENLKLSLNPAKTKAGRFGSTVVDFCGWNFAGSYVRIDNYKIGGFKARFVELVKKSEKKTTMAFLKLVNRRVDGFGNYYKAGDTLRQFEELDRFIRACVRKWLCRGQKSKRYTNDALEKMGFHSLVKCYNKAHVAKLKPLKQPTPKADLYIAKPKAPDWGAINQIAQNSESINEKLTQLLRLHREEIAMLRTLLSL
ncbi:MAG: hypothetical protein LBS36_02030 [Oscillospiraceae bacterium]|jgi:hypothetical protein|nr:hypothetical protein [Oscillospiraceae bacterium]